jgi:hypothetical protein
MRGFSRLPPGFARRAHKPQLVHEVSHFGSGRLGLDGGTARLRRKPEMIYMTSLRPSPRTVAASTAPARWKTPSSPSTKFAPGLGVRSAAIFILVDEPAAGRGRFVFSSPVNAGGGIFHLRGARWPPIKRFAVLVREERTGRRARRRTNENLGEVAAPLESIVREYPPKTARFSPGTFNLVPSGSICFPRRTGRSSAPARNMRVLLSSASPRAVWASPLVATPRKNFLTRFLAVAPLW